MHRFIRSRQMSANDLAQDLMSSERNLRVDTTDQYNDAEMSPLKQLRSSSREKRHHLDIDKVVLDRDLVPLSAELKLSKRLETLIGKVRVARDSRGSRYR